MFHICQVPDEAALESHLHLERSSSTDRPVALQRNRVRGLWVLHGKKRLKVLPQLSEAEKPDQIKKGKISSVERRIFPFCVMQTFIIITWTFPLFQQTRCLWSLKTKGKTNQRVSGSKREIQAAVYCVAWVWKAKDVQTLKPRAKTSLLNLCVRTEMSSLSLPYSTNSGHCWARENNDPLPNP